MGKTQGGDNMNEALKSYHESNRYTKIFTDEIPALATKRVHIQRVKETARAIAQVQRSAVNKELLDVLAEHHDDGRVDQYELLGKFWDTELHHCMLGAERLEAYLHDNKLDFDTETELLWKVMMYHGRLDIAENVSAEEREYIELISAADDFENGTSCVSYLIREIDTDAKGYVAANPEDNQKTVTSQMIWDCYESGTKYDKLKYCHTYADYVLFAGMLATQCIRRYGSIAKTALQQPGYGYDSILDGFKATFEYALESDDATKAYKIMCDMIENG